ncbi:MAG: FAD-dependent oxidoreductase, partial [Pseudomonadota bacterium]
MARYETLFSKFNIGHLTLRNRTVMASTGTNLSNRDGTVSDRAIAYYCERAKGKAALLITESSPVSLVARHRPESLCCYDEIFLPGIRRYTKAIRDCGSASCLQLHHSGKVIAKTVELKDGKIVTHKEGTEVEGVPPLAPSAIPRVPGAPVPREMTVEDIQEVIDQFGKTARLAKEGEFDAVEIHAAHGYLIQQFMSPRTNRRKDQYGGSTENRGRFALEILKRVRKEVGDVFPVLVRQSVREHIDGGYELEESLDWAVEMERAGASAIDVTGGSSENLLCINHLAPPMSFPKAYHVPEAEAVRKVVKIQVIAVGRIDTPALAEQILREGKADMVAFSRPFLVDPLWPAKAERGEEDRIRPCIYCNFCLYTLFQQKAITCLQNATVGKEEESRINPAKEAKKVYVIGGGPGGMEAARVAGKRGHRVTLFEKSPRLGGQLLLAQRYPNNETIMKAISWLGREVKREGVDVKLNTEGTLDMIRKEKPDVVIVATGASPVSRFDYKGPDLLNAWEILEGKETGKKVIVVGGGMVGMECAAHLYRKGCGVTVITSRDSLDKLASDLEPFTQALLLKWLPTTGISVILSARVTDVRSGEVVFNKDEKEQSLKADTIVTAGGSQPNNELLQSLKEEVPHLVSIGDCVEPRRAKDAIHEGFWAG